jgi:uncharacterized protein YaiL (DUF2058 family)
MVTREQIDIAELRRQSEEAEQLRQIERSRELHEQQLRDGGWER